MLVDSRAVVDRVCRRWARRHQLDPEMVLRIAHGRRSRDTVKAVAPHLESEREAAWIDAAELADVEGLVAVPGVRALVAAIPDMNWAVVTSCRRPLAELRLTSVGLPVPRILVTADDVSHGKPHPEGYRLGAERLGHNAAECIVFEDAPSGVDAARAAGASVIALDTTRPDADLSAADAVIPDFTVIRLRPDHGAFVVTIP